MMMLPMGAGSIVQIMLHLFAWFVSRFQQRLKYILHYLFILTSADMKYKVVISVCLSANMPDHNSPKLIYIKIGQRNLKFKGSVHEREYRLTSKN